MIIRETIEAGIGDMLVLLESDPMIEPIFVDPFSAGFDERTVDELSSEERELLWQVTCQVLKVDPSRISGLHFDEYVEENDGQLICNTFYRTGLERIFLQTMRFPDGRLRWKIGRDRS